MLTTEHSCYGAEGAKAWAETIWFPEDLNFGLELSPPKVYGISSWVFGVLHSQGLSVTALIWASDFSLACKVRQKPAQAVWYFLGRVSPRPFASQAPISRFGAADIGLHDLPSTGLQYSLAKQEAA